MNPLLFLVIGLIISECWGTECGVSDHKARSRQKRVIGGEVASFGEFPWAILVMNHGDVRCGGALISDSWAVTAAHCVNSKYALKSYFLRFGEYDTKYEYEPSPIQVRKNFEVILHPSYKTALEGNDIALLKFNPIEFRSHIRPICLPTSQEINNHVGKIATFAGWGVVFPKTGYSRILGKVELPIVNNSVCDRLFAKQYRYYTPFSDQWICSGYMHGKRGACKDEGGLPLILPRESGEWYMAGILTLNFDDCRSPSLFTNVAQHLPWIRRVMANTKEEE